MTSESKDGTTPVVSELLSEPTVPEPNQLALVEMGRAERETKGGFFGSFDFHAGWQP